MINGTIISANLGNFLPNKMRYTFSLSNIELAKLINRKISKLQPKICFLQEVWTFTRDLIGKNYEFIGLNDSIAVFKDFASIIRNSYKSNCVKFKKSLKDNIYPDFKDRNEVQLHEELLSKNPYKGDINSPYGIPAGFDLSSVLIETKQDKEKILLGNIHLTSAPWNHSIRSKEIDNWIINDLIPRSKEKCNGTLIIAGDFNQDEYRQNNECSKKIMDLKDTYNLNDASFGDKRVTTNYPFFLKNYKYDHIFGTCRFSDYIISQSLLGRDFRKFKKRHPFTWWMHLDHKLICAKFEF